MEGLVLDLFGTIVPAPTAEDRTGAATRLAPLVGCSHEKIDAYFRQSWRIRHDGTLSTLAELAAHLELHAKCEKKVTGAVANELVAIAFARLIAAESVLHTLRRLRRQRLRLAVLSDASADIASAWGGTQLAPLIDITIFSCIAGEIKPAPRLYRQICDQLQVPPHQILYVGDGGGDELRGAQNAGMAAVRVRRRGPKRSLAFGETRWHGEVLDGLENVPDYLEGRS